MVETKVKKSFRLSQQSVAYLETYAKEHNETLTDALEHVLEWARRSTDNTGDKNTETADNSTETTDKRETVPVSVIEALTNQLDAKDHQIEGLMQALLRAQEQGHNAQVLNAMDKGPALLEKQTESTATGSTENPVTPLGDMTFRQLFKAWRKSRK